MSSGVELVGVSVVQTRKRVLINAFTVRALRDGFAPARVAGKLLPTEQTLRSLKALWICSRSLLDKNCFPVAYLV